MQQMNPDTDNVREFPQRSLLSNLLKRFLQVIALYIPGESSLRVLLHRWRGVRVGKNVYIGTDVLIETAFPEWVSIGSYVSISPRAMILAHIQELPPRRADHTNYISVRIEDDVHIGPGAILLPNVTIGRGAVVAAGSVVTRSVAPLTMVQGNPAKQIAECGIPLSRNVNLKEFYRRLRPVTHAKIDP